MFQIVTETDAGSTAKTFVFIIHRRPRPPEYATLRTQYVERVLPKLNASTNCFFNTSIVTIVSSAKIRPWWIVENRSNVRCAMFLTVSNTIIRI